MSHTRKAPAGTPFRQERFSSSVEYERGLMANLVAKRCSVLERAADRQLVYFLQLRSHHEDGLNPISEVETERQAKSRGAHASGVGFSASRRKPRRANFFTPQSEGRGRDERSGATPERARRRRALPASISEFGLKGVVAALLTRFEAAVGTRSMHQIGHRAGQHYSAAEVRRIRGEFPDDKRWDFLTKGETRADLGGMDECIGLRSEEQRREHARRVAHDALMSLGRYDDDWKENPAERAEADARPDSIAAEEFLKTCRHAAETELESDLKRLCLDPGIALDDSWAGFVPWYFPTALAALRQYQAEWIQERQRGVVVTELGRKVCATLEFTAETACLTLIDGAARTGKTFSVKAWCDLHPGSARYVQVPCMNDEIGFFRAIARSLGVSVKLTSKAQELRGRVEEVLQRGHLTVVFDEAHYLWPHCSYRDAMPSRINWIMTALANEGVPVCLVTTPQFLRTQKVIERKTSWTSEQFVGRIGHYEKLPDCLEEADLTQVARSLLPEGSAKAVEILVRYAQGSAKYLAAIETAVRRARYLAGKAGRSEVADFDVRSAIKDSVIPSDSALATALEESAKGTCKRPLMVVESPVNAPLPAAPIRQISPPMVAAGGAALEAAPSRQSAPRIPIAAHAEDFSGSQRVMHPRLARELATV